MRRGIASPCVAAVHRALKPTGSFYLAIGVIPVVVGLMGSALTPDIADPVPDTD